MPDWNIIVSAPVLSDDAVRATEILRTLGFRVDSSTGSYRLTRSDGSQAAFYSLKGNPPQFAAANSMGQSSLSGNVGNLVNFDSAEVSAAAIAGLELAQIILKDESQRRTTLPQFAPPSLDSRPYG